MLAIVYEGCACRAAFHAGVTTALAEGGLRVDLAAGASSGSIAAAAWAAGIAGELVDRWRALSGRSVVSVRRAVWNRSIFDMSHLVRSALRDAFGTGDLRDRVIEAIVTATELPSLRSVSFSSREEPDFVEAMLASCFFPVLYGRPIRIRGRWLLDGGLRDNLPIEQVVARGADDVVCVTPSHERVVTKSARRSRWRPTAEGARVHVVAPRKPLSVRSWDLDRDRIARAMHEGYERGREFLGSR